MTKQYRIPLIIRKQKRKMSHYSFVSDLVRACQNWDNIWLIDCSVTCAKDIRNGEKEMKRKKSVMFTTNINKCVTICLQSLYVDVRVLSHHHTCYTGQNRICKKCMGWWTVWEVQRASFISMLFPSLQWRHNAYDGVSNHQPHHCLLNRLFTCRLKKTSELRVTGLCAGYSPGTGVFPAKMASNARNAFIWWCHHDISDL